MDRAGKEIAPEVGASIVVCSNGSRILDQLGVLEDVTEGTVALNRAFTWTEKGTILVQANSPVLVEKRYIRRNATNKGQNSSCNSDF